jgi:hypothetical protein
MRRRRIGAALVAALLLVPLLGPGGAAAHPLAPSSLLLREGQDGQVEQVWRAPRQPADGAAVLRPVPPAGCAPIGPAQVRPLEDGTAVEERTRLRCAPGGLAGRRLRVEGLADGPGQVLVRVQRTDGGGEEWLLHAGRPEVTVGEVRSAADVLLAHAGLGLRHLLGGADHVLFLAALLVLLGRTSTLLWALTAFTAGHALSLSLATLTGWRWPGWPVEVAIAATLLVLAMELVRPPSSRVAPATARAAAACLAAGLLHGLGFAGGLLEAGLPRARLPAALIGFNLGLELGQLAVALLVLGTVSLLRAASRGAPWYRRLAAPATRLVAYAIGPLAVYWILERSWRALG